MQQPGQQQAHAAGPGAWARTARRGFQQRRARAQQRQALRRVRGEQAPGRRQRAAQRAV